MIYVAKKVALADVDYQYRSTLVQLLRDGVSSDSGSKGPVLLRYSSVTILGTLYMPKKCWMAVGYQNNDSLPKFGFLLIFWNVVVI
jgi:hypothetical protein